MSNSFYKNIAIVIALLTLFLAEASPLEAEEKVQQTSAGSEADFVKHVNAGVVLVKTGKAEECIEEFKKAAAIKPNDPLVLVNLGQAYQVSGKNAEALDQYQKYLKLYPKGPYVAQITSMFQVMQRQVMLNGGKTSQGQDNYLLEALAGGGGRWEQSQMPLTVYIANGAGVEGYSDKFPEIIKKAFADWSDASQGKIRVTYVESSDKARIICKWTCHVKDLANSAEGGQALVQMGLERALLKADILCLTHNGNVPADVNPAGYMRLVALHEIGHSLGLTGHSSQYGDVMFGVMNYESATKELSDRDKKTILMLYSSPTIPSSTTGTSPIILQMKPWSKVDSNKSKVEKQ